MPHALGGSVAMTRGYDVGVLLNGDFVVCESGYIVVIVVKDLAQGKEIS